MSKVLIVVDMQNDFIDGVLGTKEVEAIVRRVSDKIKKHEGIVVYTKDTHRKNYLTTQEGHNLPIVHCIEGTYGWELQKDIKKLSEDNHSKVYKKNTFGSGELVEYLMELSEKEGIEEIELGGLC